MKSLVLDDVDGDLDLEIAGAVLGLFEGSGSAGCRRRSWSAARPLVGVVADGVGDVEVLADDVDA